MYAVSLSIPGGENWKAESNSGDRTASLNDRLILILCILPDSRNPAPLCTHDAKADSPSLGHLFPMANLTCVYEAKDTESD